jgi:hypothetical protein
VSEPEYIELSAKSNCTAFVDTILKYLMLKIDDRTLGPFKDIKDYVERYRDIDEYAKRYHVSDVY